MKFLVLPELHSYPLPEAFLYKLYNIHTTMKTKIFNFLMTSIAAVALLTSHTNATESHKVITQTNINLEKIQSSKAAIAPKTTQFSQLKLAKQTEDSTSRLIEVFITFTTIGFILGCIFQYIEYKRDCLKWRDQILLQMETLEKIHLLEIENSEKIQKMTSNIDQTITPERVKQIETLERIWNMKS